VVIKEEYNSKWWNEGRVQDLCKKWQEATKESEKYKIYHELYPFFRVLARQISNGFEYSVIVSAVDRCFIAIKNYNFQYKAFSYFSKIIRSEIYTYLKQFKYKYQCYDSITDDMQQQSLVIADYDTTNYKELLISHLRNYRFRYDKYNNSTTIKEIISAICQFIESHDSYTIIDIVLFLKNQGYKIKDIRVVFNHALNTYIHQHEDSKDDADYEKISAGEDYYDALMYQNKNYKEDKIYQQKLRIERQKKNGRYKANTIDIKQD